MCSLKDILKPLVMAEHFCEEQNCSLCMSAIKTAQELVVKNFPPTNNARVEILRLVDTAQADIAKGHIVVASGVLDRIRAKLSPVA